MVDASRQAAFEQEFRTQIERFTQKLVTALRTLIATPVPQIIKVLAFEMQPDWREFPVHVFAMDDECLNEVYFQPPFKSWVLPNAGELVPRGAIDQDMYQQAGVATFESGARVMAEWVGECWHAAGERPDFPIPAYIHMHDSSRYFDLRERRWARDTDIWR